MSKTAVRIIEYSDTHYQETSEQYGVYVTDESRPCGQFMTLRCIGYHVHGVNALSVALRSAYELRLNLVTTVVKVDADVVYIGDIPEWYEEFSYPVAKLLG